jgi:hypothetical protein
MEEESNEQNHSTERCFPSQLFVMLTKLENDGLSHIVSWQPHGRAFLVHQRDEFINVVLPQ